MREGSKIREWSYAAKAKGSLYRIEDNAVNHSCIISLSSS